MNRLGTLLIICAAMLVSGSFAQQVLAQTALPEEHVERIRQNCGTAQTALRQLRDSDAALRRNRGDLYGDVSTKLMAPLNTRIAANRLDGIKLGSTALQYDKQVELFRTSYTDYAKSMERTVAIDCAKNPVEFYESVAATREKRQKLHQENQAVVTLIELYRSEFEVFAESNKGAANE